MFGRREPTDRPNQLKSLINYNSQIFAVERSEQITALVYSGEKSVRRVRFAADKSVSVEWEFAVSDLDFCGRFDDVMILPGQNKGLRAVDLVSGETRWEVGHPSIVCKALYSSGGSLFAFFQDQVWLEINAKTGEIRSNGKLSNERELQNFLSKKQQLTPSKQRYLYLKGGQISVRFDTLYVEDGTDSERLIDIQCPKKGEYPIDGWQPDDGVCIIENKLAAWLKRTWSGKHQTAVGFFDLPSLTPRCLVQLGENTSSGSCSNLHVVDGLLFVGGNIKKPDNENDYTYGKYLIDPITESVIAVFVRGHNSIFFFDGEPYWWGAL
jgi:hypothetical protein